MKIDIGDATKKGLAVPFDFARVLATTEGQIALLAGWYISSLAIPDLHKGFAYLVIAVVVIICRTVEKGINGPSERALLPQPSQPQDRKHESADAAEERREAVSIVRSRPLSAVAAVALMLLVAACAGPGAYEDRRLVVIDTCQALRPALDRVAADAARDRFDLAQLDRLDLALNEYEAICVEGDPATAAETSLAGWLARLDGVMRDLQAMEAR